MKVIKKVFKKSLRKVVELDEMHMKFMSGKGMNDAIFIRQMTEKYVSV